MTTIVTERADSHFYDAALERHPYFSWGAALAGALAGCAVIFMLLALGSGLGLMLAGPVSDPSTPLKTILTASGIYFFAVEAFGFAIGGYIAGRLCGPMLVSRQEEMFRSGAHGLVVWALSVAAGAAFLLISAGIAANTAGHAASSSGMAMMHRGGPAETPPSTVAYWTDTLLRVPAQNQATAAAPAPAEGTAPSATPAAAMAAPAEPRKVDPEARAELTRILTVNAMRPQAMSADDHARVVEIVAEQTGISQADAEQRVTTLMNRVHDEETKAAETARKSAAYISIWMALSLFFGLLVATGAAVLARMEEEEDDDKETVTTVRTTTGEAPGLRR